MSIFLVQFFALGLPCPKNDYDPLNYSYDFDTPELPYPYTSLEPIVWAEVVYFHHEKHHEEASKHLNKIIEEK